MTDLTADEIAERIIRSLKENSAAFQKKRRAEHLVRVRTVVEGLLLFSSGAIAGVALMTRQFAQFTIWLKSF